MTRLAYILATCLGTGYSPKAPGTAGTLFALILFFLFPQWTGWILFISMMILFFIGVWVSDIVEKDSGIHDAQLINLDEFVGMGLSILWFPEQSRFWVLILGFLFFRLYDITKPFPINKSQNAPGGWGVMLDDVIAGIFANISLRFIFFLTTLVHYGR